METKYVAVVGVAFLLLSLILYLATHPTRSGVRVRIATTTSLYTTGLLDYMAKRFTEQYPEAEILFISVGSGAALRYAERGDVCAVLIHEPGLERRYVEKRVIGGQRIFAYNFFVIVGPRDDPANVSGAQDAVDAFRRIYSTGEVGLAHFISRADSSGTYLRELYIWRLVDTSPVGRAWYRECGCGMDQALVMASEVGAYTLSDVGTFTALRWRGRVPGLEVLYSNSTDYTLINIYSGYIVEGCRGVERRYAELFLDFIYSNQNILEDFNEMYGAELFYPVKYFGGDINDVWSRVALGE